MIEIPEAAVLAQQINQLLRGKRIARGVAGASPHKFAWFSGDPTGYSSLLAGRQIGEAAAWGGMVEIEVEEMRLLFGDGVNLRFHPTMEEIPLKHQLLVELDDGSALSATVAMYGGIWCYEVGTNQNPYFQAAVEKPSPLSQAFDRAYFESLFAAGTETMPLKGFLATQQRIPGLGNGALQDILYRVGLHPRTKVAGLSQAARDGLFVAVKDVLSEMFFKGGRDTECDLWGRPGGYSTRMSKYTAGKPCPTCGSPIHKETYLGGSIYFCPGCQRVS